MAIGTAPDDVWGVYQQRGQWAVDTMRLFLWDNPLVKKGLSWFARASYSIIGLTYISSAFVFPFFFVVPLWSYLTGSSVFLERELEFLVARGTYFVCMVLALQYLFRRRQPGKQFRTLTGLFG